MKMWKNGQVKQKWEKKNDKSVINGSSSSSSSDNDGIQSKKSVENENDTTAYSPTQPQKKANY